MIWTAKWWLFITWKNSDQLIHLNILGTFIVSFIHTCMLSHFNSVRLFVILWNITCQAPLSVGFSREEYWSGLPFPSPGDPPHPGIEPTSPVSPDLQADSLPTEPSRKLHNTMSPAITRLPSRISWGRGCHASRLPQTHESGPLGGIQEREPWWPHLRTHPEWQEGPGGQRAGYPNTRSLSQHFTSPPHPWQLYPHAGGALPSPTQPVALSLSGCLSHVAMCLRSLTPGQDCGAWAQAHEGMRMGVVFS